MVAARSAAMAFNRLVDADIDALNPRTSVRALPAGLLTRGFVLGFTIAASALLFFAAWMLNPLAFYLSPLALLIVCAYSYTKRFTRWAHLFLGFAMGIAPAAAWVAVRGTLDPRVLIVTAAVMFWGGGFDILYSCQDYHYDIASGLYSVPRAFGIAGALRLARVFHLIAFAFFAWMLFSFGLGRLAIAGVAITGIGSALRAHAGQGRRPEQAQRRLLHHQRLHLHADSLRRHRRPHPAGPSRLAQFQES